MYLQGLCRVWCEGWDDDFLGVFYQNTTSNDKGVEVEVLIRSHGFKWKIWIVNILFGWNPLTAPQYKTFVVVVLVVEIVML